MKPFATLTALFATLLLILPESTAREVHPPVLTKIFEGEHLVLFTSGKNLRVGRNPKAGVWSTPTRLAKEMWVQRKGEPKPVRLDPFSFQKQLTGLLAEYEEAHRFIRGHEFTYKSLPEHIPALDEHITRILETRPERQENREKLLAL